MRTKTFVALLLSFLCCHLVLAAEPFNRIEGYGKTVWGMTLDEVLKAEPRATALAEPEKYEWSYGLAQIKEIDIGTAKFKAEFLFQSTDNRLSQVNVSSDEKKNHLVNISRFRELERMLTEKYGTPTYKTDFPTNREGNRTISWKFDKTKIELTHLYLSGVITRLLVTYRPSEVTGGAGDL